MSIQDIQELGEDYGFEVDQWTAQEIYDAIPLGIVGNKQWLKKWVLGRIKEAMK